MSTAPTDDSTPDPTSFGNALRFLDAGPAEGALDALAAQGVRPQELVSCEVFYDPAALTAAQARDAVRSLDPSGRLPVAVVPADVGLLSPAGTRVQVTALPPGEDATYAEDGRWAAGGAVVTTTLVTAPGAGDIVAQSHAILRTVTDLLAERGVGLDDVVKFNIYYQGEGTAQDWGTAAAVRAGYFTEPGPATTGIPVPRFEDPDVLIAMHVLAVHGVRDRRTHSWPPDHWDWPFHLPYQHGNRAGGLALVGGQVPLDGDAQPLDVGDFAAQVDRSLVYIDRILAELSVPRAAVQRLTAFVAVSAEDATDKQRALDTAMAEFFTGCTPMPAVVAVPLPVLAYPEMDVEIEVQAWVS